MSESKVCNKCGEAKHLDAFAKNRSNPDGLQRACRDCMSKQRSPNKTTNKRRRTYYPDEYGDSYGDESL